MNLRLHVLLWPSVYLSDPRETEQRETDSYTMNSQFNLIKWGLFQMNEMTLCRSSGALEVDGCRNNQTNWIRDTASERGPMKWRWREQLLCETCHRWQNGTPAGHEYSLMKRCVCVCDSAAHLMPHCSQSFQCSEHTHPLMRSRDLSSLSLSSASLLLHLCSFSILYSLSVFFVLLSCLFYFNIHHSILFSAVGKCINIHHLYVCQCIF